MTEIHQRAAVVTGGASGIGLGIAEQLIAEGARVVIADIDAAAAEREATRLGALHRKVDVSRPESVQELAEFTVRELGGVDIVVNNAGVGPLARATELTLDDWKWMLDVNLFGVINGVQSFLPHLLANPSGGHIVNTSSISGLTVTQGVAAYAASKYAVVGLSEAMALEFAEDAPDVHVTVLVPGTVRTDIKNGLRNRPAGSSGALRDIDLAATELGQTVRWIDPIDAGRITTRAIRNNDLYAVTHPDWWHLVEERHTKLRDAFQKYADVEVSR